MREVKWLIPDKGDRVSQYLIREALHLARASGEDHASTLVPPQSVSMRPIGYWSWSYRFLPKNQHVAEK